MNIKAFFTRNVKKSNSRNDSRNDVSNDVTNDAEKQKKREERRLQKLARQEKKQTRLAKIEERQEKKQKRLAKKERQKSEEDRIPKPEEEVSNSSSTPSRPELGTRRTRLRPDLKDKFSDILNNQPRVVLADVVDEYFRGHYDFYTWSFLDRCITQPKTVVEKMSITQPKIVLRKSWVYLSICLSLDLSFYNN